MYEIRVPILYYPLYYSHIAREPLRGCRCSWGRSRRVSVNDTRRRPSPLLRSRTRDRGAGDRRHQIACRTSTAAAYIVSRCKKYPSACTHANLVSDCAACCPPLRIPHDMIHMLRYEPQVMHKYVHRSRTGGSLARADLCQGRGGGILIFIN